MNEGGPEPERLSFNQITADQLTLAEVVECASAGIGWIRPCSGTSSSRARPSSSVRPACGVQPLQGRFLPEATEAERRVRDADNRHAVEEAAELGTDVLVLVCGGARGAELGRARDEVLAGIERLVPFAADHGVVLAIEPLHPMMVVERSVVVTLGQANGIAERFDPARSAWSTPITCGGTRISSARSSGPGRGSLAATSPTGWSRRPIFWPAAA